MGWALTRAILSHTVFPPRGLRWRQGNVKQEQREHLWSERRVFFCTPQTAQNDFRDGRVDPSLIVLLVIDEAHRAIGNSAYVNVVRELSAVKKEFRLLALSATPGADKAKVQEVLDKLLIARVEVRSEDEPEVKRHTHMKAHEYIEIEIADAAMQDMYDRLEVSGARARSRAHERGGSAERRAPRVGGEESPEGGGEESPEDGGEESPEGGGEESPEGGGEESPEGGAGEASATGARASLSGPSASWSGSRWARFGG